VKHAQENPDVSRHVTAVATNLVTSLIDCAKANPSVADLVMTCVQSLQKHYFGAVGPVVRNLEKFLLDNLVSFFSVATTGRRFEKQSLKCVNYDLYGLRMMFQSTRTR